MPRACCSAGQCWQSWRWSNRDLPKDSKLHHPKIVIIAWHISPIKENCDPLRQKFNIEVSQLPRACPDSGPSSFLLAKQTLRRPHEKSNRLPQNSCKLRMSQDFNRRPQSIRTLVGSITERRVLATDFNLVSAAPAMRPAGKTLTPPRTHQSGSADHGWAVWPDPRTDHVCCYFRLGSLWGSWSKEKQISLHSSKAIVWT